MMVYCILGNKPIEQNTELAELNVITDTKGTILFPLPTDKVKVSRQYRTVLR